MSAQSKSPIHSLWLAVPFDVLGIALVLVGASSKHDRWIILVGMVFIAAGILIALLTMVHRVEQLRKRASKETSAGSAED